MLDYTMKNIILVIEAIILNNVVIIQIICYYY